jgi:hypothetical protein
MSATLQEDKFQQYFNNCPILYISGRTFPVNVHYYNDCLKLLNKRQLKTNGKKVPFFFLVFIISQFSFFFFGRSRCRAPGT